MTQEQHCIIPPAELRRLWAQQAQRINPHDPVEWMQHVAKEAAQWGYQQAIEELENYLEKQRDN